MHSFPFPVGAAAMMSLLIAGCGSSPPTNFYVLNDVAQHSAAGSASMISVGFRSVRLPAYADRPQMVTRESSTDLQLAEFHQWAEPLRDSVVRVLADNLAKLLSTDHVFAFPRETQPRYWVSVDLARFDAEAQDAVLIAQWTLTNSNGGEALVVKRTHLTAQADLSDYSSIAKALSEVLGQLSSEIAAAIRSAEDGG